jgi:hypothetical protein
MRLGRKLMSWIFLLQQKIAEEKKLNRRFLQECLTRMPFFSFLRQITILKLIVSPCKNLLQTQFDFLKLRFDC